MSATSTETIKQELSLLDDLILNENDLTEEAKARFPYHKDILSAFEVYRCRILQDRNLSPVARHKLFATLGDFYAKSKEVLNCMAENNELLSHNLPNVGPVVICGAARTGTTLLYNLLACDPHCRAPLLTDMVVRPVPPIARSNFIEQERRATEMQLLSKMFSESTEDPKIEIAASHPYYSIEEDYHILSQAGFPFVHFMITLNDQPEFSVGLSNEMKKDYIYNYHKLFLRMLNSVDPPSSHWLLKTPAHIFYLDTLLRHYPNAALIITHRNINEVLPSYYRLMLNVAKLYSVDVNSPSVRKALMTQYTQVFDKEIECLVKFRTQQSGQNIFDMNYDDLMEQPIATARRIYDHFGLKWSDEFEKGMESWLRNNPQGIQGRHIYSLADFNLTEEDIEARYDDYINLFLRSPSSSKTNKIHETA